MAKITLKPLSKNDPIFKKSFMTIKLNKNKSAIKKTEKKKINNLTKKK